MMKVSRYGQKQECTDSANSLRISAALKVTITKELSKLAG